MASRLFFPVVGLALSVTLLDCGSSSNGTPATAQTFHSPRLQGTFFDKNTFQDGQWRSTFEAMQAAGLTQAVVNASADASAMTTRYPTALPGFTMVYPTLPAGFPNASTQHIDMYLGLQSNDDWWDGVSSTNPDWLAAQAALSNQVADELFSLYGTEPQFKGWYLPFEVDNVTFMDPATWDYLVTFYSTVAGHLHTIAPGKAVIIAPFYNPYAGGEDSPTWRQMWAHILANAPIDVIALQDGVGAGNTTIDDQPEWFAATKGAIADAGTKTQLWSDTETYNIADWSPMSINGLVADINAEAPFVSNMISWSFSDYLDPHTTNPFYYLTYLEYATTGAQDTTAPGLPTSLSAQASDANDVTLTWNAPTDDTGVVAYDMNRNGTVTRIYLAAGPYGDTGLTGGTSYTYTLAAVDAAGNVSAASAPSTAVTPVEPVYTTDLALGKPYTASAPADPGYPDVGGTSLTDGLYATSDFLDPGWQGRAGVTCTWIVDLGSVQLIHGLSSDWMNEPGPGIVLPASVSYAVSTDNATWTPVGTVTPTAVPDSVWHKELKVNYLNVQAQYVQVTGVTSGGWNFIDELEVWQ